MLYVASFFSKFATTRVRVLSSTALTSNIDSSSLSQLPIKLNPVIVGFVGIAVDATFPVTASTFAVLSKMPLPFQNSTFFSVVSVPLSETLSYTA